MGQTIVVALGGNALIHDNQNGSFDEQLQNAHDVADRLMSAIDDDTRLALAHGNGPQVGNLQLQNDVSGDRVRELPLFGSNAASQGLIGSMLGLAFNNLFLRKDMPRRAVPMLTPVIVETEELSDPTKPIGPFYTAKEAQRQETDKIVFHEDAGRGWRRVVPSPEPDTVALTDEIVEIIDNGDVPIVTGGGGLPILETDVGEFEYVDAVVDKDLAAAQLADQIDADRLVILTDVEHVLLNYGTDDETALREIDSEKAREYLDDGHFERGSMYEKVQAACNFVENGSNRNATITSLERSTEAIEGTGGTQIAVKK